MKALLFGGTFDPPHAGHMNNLRAAMQAVQPDVVLVMPAGIPPHKHASATPGELRLAMCECFKALGPQVQVSQWEVDRAGRSYTYNTVSMLQEKYPGAQLYMTIGSDMLETFDEWYRWREILAMVTLVVQSREPGDGDALRAAAQKLEKAGGKIMFAGVCLQRYPRRKVSPCPAEGAAAPAGGGCDTPERAVRQADLKP